MIHRPLVDPATVIHLVKFKKVVCGSSTGRRTKKETEATCRTCAHIMNLAYPEGERR